MAPFKIFVQNVLQTLTELTENNIYSNQHIRKRMWKKNGKHPRSDRILSALKALVSKGDVERKYGGYRLVVGRNYEEEEEEVEEEDDDSGDESEGEGDSESG